MMHEVMANIASPEPFISLNEIEDFVTTPHDLDDPLLIKYRCMIQTGTDVDIVNFWDTELLDDLDAIFGRVLCETLDKGESQFKEGAYGDKWHNPWHQYVEECVERISAKSELAARRAQFLLSPLISNDKLVDPPIEFILVPLPLLTASVMTVIIHAFKSVKASLTEVSVCSSATFTFASHPPNID